MSTVIRVPPNKNSHFKNLIPMFHIILDNNFDLNVIIDNSHHLKINGPGIREVPVNLLALGKPINAI